MSDRKITAPGPGWRMPGKAKSTNIRDAMPNLLNAMGDSIERSNKMDFGTPGIHTQNGFQQPHETAFNSPVWVLLSTDLPTGTYDAPSNAYAKILVRDSSIGESSLVEGVEEVVVWNYSQNFSANSGDWTMAIPFGGNLVVLPSGGGSSSAEIIKFEVVSACSGLAAGANPGNCNCVNAVVTRNSCNASIAIGDQITVWDIYSCWFTVPLDLLVGRSGTAILLEDNVNDGSAPNCTGAGADRPQGQCYWNVESLCCSEEYYAT